MARNRCCCAECWIAEDSFNRDTGLGDKWVVVGDETNWAIETGDQLYSSSGWGILTCLHSGPLVTSVWPHFPQRYEELGGFNPPDLIPWNHIIYVKLANLGNSSTGTGTGTGTGMGCGSDTGGYSGTCLGTGDDCYWKGYEWGIICGYVNENNFKWVRLAYCDGKLYPQFISRVDGVDYVLMDHQSHPVGVPLAVGSAPVIRICYSESDWTVETATHPTTGEGTWQDWKWTRCGGGSLKYNKPYIDSLNIAHRVGFVGFLFGEFDDFLYMVHWEDNLNCPYCSCMCMSPDDTYGTGSPRPPYYADYSCFPEEMTITLVPKTPYYCPDLDYLSIKLYQCLPEVGHLLPTYVGPIYHKSPEKKLWYSDVIQIEDEYVWFVFYCPDRLNCISYPGTSLTGLGANYLYFAYPDSGGHYQIANWKFSTCKPLNLVFEGLYPGINTCDIETGTPPVPYKSGTRPRPCHNGDCWDAGEELTVWWDAVITI
jgi:hypothetical protein